MKENTDTQSGLEDFLQNSNLTWFKIYTQRAPLSVEVLLEGSLSSVEPFMTMSSSSAKN